LLEAQEIAELVTRAEARIGEMLLEVPKATPNNNPHHENDTAVDFVKPKGEIIRELGFSQKQAERLQKIAENPDVVEQAIAEARENDDIVSRSLILARIKDVELEQRRQSVRTVEPQPLNGKYDVIYADPPWRHDFGDMKNRNVINQYPTMPLEQIKEIDVPSEDNAVLLLWATAPLLDKAISVMEVWGFSYRSCAVWDKEKIGMGFWFRGQHELLLLGMKGEYRTPQTENRFSSVYREARTQHSKKPDFYYDMIERMFPNGKYLELFARQKYSDKWTVWGNAL